MTKFYQASTMFSLLVFFCFATNNVNAQATFDEIYTILQTNCQGVTCHTSQANAGGLAFDGSKTDIYNAIIEATPTTSEAVTRNEKLVDPGHPERSFLLKKVSHGLGIYQTEDLELSANDGLQMPAAGNSLTEAEVELIRQWIFFGAPETGKVTEFSNLKDYYENHAGDYRITRPDPPAPGEGFQIHHGPIFFEPFDEKEYRLKYDLQLDVDLEVTGVDVKMNDESHHFILYAFQQRSDADNAKDGLREITLQSGGGFDTNTDYILAWQNDQNIELPEGTAYKWDTDKVLDLNYHVFNPHNAPLPGEVYINVYTQPKGTAVAEMSTALVNSFLIGIGPIKLIPSDNQPHSFTDRWTTGTSIPGHDSISIWMLSTHTHERGIDYDVYLADDNGAKDDQIYEGYYSFDYGYDQGFFDWEHPPVRFFEPLLELDGNKGVLHEATYQNNTGSPLGFGLTTNDEMMIIYLNYVEGNYKLNTTSAPEVKVENTFDIAPNPFMGNTNIRYNLANASDVQLEVFDLMGRKVTTLTDEFQNAGQHTYQFSGEGRASGVYFVRLTIDGETFTQKVVETSRN